MLLAVYLALLVLLAFVPGCAPASTHAILAGWRRRWRCRRHRRWHRRFADNRTLWRAESPIPLFADVVIIGVRERGTPRFGIVVLISLEDALVVGDPAKYEWEHAGLVWVGVAHRPAAGGDGGRRWRWLGRRWWRRRRWATTIRTISRTSIFGTNR